MAAKNNIREAIVSYAVQKSLIEYNSCALEEIYQKLHEDHGLHFVDCYNNPDILRKVLLETFGDAYCNIVELVRTYLGQYAVQEQVRKFLQALE